MATTTTTTTTITLNKQTLNLNLSSLKTVAWLEANPVVQDVTAFTKTQVDRARTYTLISWIFAILQYQLLWVWTLVHTVPWPGTVVGLVYRADDVVESVLEAVFQKLEWWWDYITIRVMRAIETVVTYLDKVITFVDHAIDWVLQRHGWVLDVALRVLVVVKGVYDWVLGLYAAAWARFKRLVHDMQQMWAVSQEEVQSLAEQAEQQQQQLQQLLVEQTQGVTLRSNGDISSASSKRLSFSVPAQNHDGLTRQSSDSDVSDIADLQETRTMLVGEQTGISYSKVHTEATVVGRQRDAMYRRVTARLHSMRKNSIKFSRGMDVRVSRMIGSVQNKFTPRSLVSLLLSLLKFFILSPFKVIIWVVGGKRLSRRARSMRSESTLRREAAAAADSANLPVTPLSPVALLHSAEPVKLELNSLHKTDTVKKIEVETFKEEEQKISQDNRRDSGVSEDNHDSSEESNGVIQIQPPSFNYQTRHERRHSVSSSSVISEEPEENRSCTTPSPPQTPPTPSTPRVMHKCLSKDYPDEPVVQSATSAPDLQSSSIASDTSSVGADLDTLSTVSAPDQYSPPQERKIKKRVTIKS